jgi:hypothetical protein
LEQESFYADHSTLILAVTILLTAKTVNAIVTGYSLVGLFWRSRAVFGHLAFFHTEARRHGGGFKQCGGCGVGVEHARHRVTRLTFHAGQALPLTGNRRRPTLFLSTWLLVFVTALPSHQASLMKG